MKRAITLAGGGPAVGLSIGAMKRINEENDIHFDVWAMACIGAWFGIVYNQADKGQEIEQSVEFFRKIFRPDDVYSRFPIASVFAPDYVSATKNIVRFIMDPNSYRNLVIPQQILEASEVLMGYITDPRQWTVSSFNALMLNQIMAVNPITRFMTSMQYQNATNGLSRIYYPDSEVLRQIRFERLYDPDKPYLYHNAYNLTDQRLDLFSNKPKTHPQYGSITGQSLCACSALPYIEQTVEIGDKTYCEGATVDTVNFENLLIDHPDLDEVWVSRILDRKQIHKPENMYDALNNLVMLFAATTSEDDVKLFKYHLKDIGSKVRVVEIPVAAHINYDWNYSNLDRSIADGYLAAEGAIAQYRLDTGKAPAALPAPSATPVSGKARKTPEPVA